MNDCIHEDDYAYFQPVDTWIERAAESLRIVSQDDLGKRRIVKDKIIVVCFVLVYRHYCSTLAHGW